MRIPLPLICVTRVEACAFVMTVPSFSQVFLVMSHLYTPLSLTQGKISEKSDHEQEFWYLITFVFLFFRYRVADYVGTVCKRERTY